MMRPKQIYIPEDVSLNWYYVCNNWWLWSLFDCHIQLRFNIHNDSISIKLALDLYWSKCQKKNIIKKILWFFISNISFTDTKVEFIILCTCWKNASKTFSFNLPHAVYRCISGNVKQKRGRRRIDPKRFKNSIWNMPFEHHLLGFWWNVSAIPKINNVDKYHLSVYTYTWLLWCTIGNKILVGVIDQKQLKRAWASMRWTEPHFGWTSFQYSFSISSLHETSLDRDL